jgi:hypothetical protein
MAYAICLNNLKDYLCRSNKKMSLDVWHALQPTLTMHHSLPRLTCGKQESELVVASARLLDDAKRHRKARAFVGVLYLMLAS